MAQVIAIPVDAPVPEKARVAWAVAAHRALIENSSGTARPAMITGAYAAGVRRPANRIALHMLDAGTGAEAPGPCLLVMIPAGTSPLTWMCCSRQSWQLRFCAARRGRPRKLDTSQIRVMDGSRFWSPPAARRHPAVADGARRHPRDPRVTGRRVELRPRGPAVDGFRVEGPAPAGQGLRGAATRTTGAWPRRSARLAWRLCMRKAVRTADVDRYVHKVNEHAVVRPYTACLSLGSLAGPGTISAIGQSRHLGGGLLIPLRRPGGRRRSRHPAAA